MGNVVPPRDAERSRRVSLLILATGAIGGTCIGLVVSIPPSVSTLIKSADDPLLWTYLAPLTLIFSAVAFATSVAWAVLCALGAISARLVAQKVNGSPVWEYFSIFIGSLLGSVPGYLLAEVM